MRKIFKISSSFVRIYIINIMNIPRNRIYRVRCVRFILRILFFHVILLKYRQDLKDIQIDRRRRKLFTRIIPSNLILSSCRIFPRTNHESLSRFEERNIANIPQRRRRIKYIYINNFSHHLTNVQSNSIVIDKFFCKLDPSVVMNFK